MNRIQPFLFVAMLAFAHASWASYKEDYLEGLEALGKSNWAEAERLLSRAAQEEPKPQARMRLYGMRFQTYLPHFYLGKAQYEVGNCEAARMSFSRSLEFGVVNKLAELRELRKLDGECESQAAQSRDMEQRLAEQLQRQIKDQSDRATRILASASAKVQSARSTSGADVWRDQWQSGGDLATTATNIETRVQSLRERVNAAREAKDPDQLAGMEQQLTAVENQAVAFEQSVQRQLRLLRQEREERAQERVAQRDQTARQEAERAAQAKAAANASITENVEKATALVSNWPAGMTLGTERQALQALVAEAYAAGNATLSELQRLDRRLAAAVNTTTAQVEAWRKELASRPPEALVFATNEYFQGNYERALELIGKMQAENDKARFYQSLFAAAARFQLWTIAQGSTGDPLYRLASNDLRSARRLVDDLELDARVFSPKFIAFAESVSAE